MLRRDQHVDWATEDRGGEGLFPKGRDLCARSLSQPTQLLSILKMHQGSVATTTINPAWNFSIG